MLTDGRLHPSLCADRALCADRGKMCCVGLGGPAPEEASGAGSATVGAVGKMRIPPLGPRGEGWVVAQIALGALIVSAGIAGPEWSSAARTALLFAGIGIGIAGLALFI